MTPFNLEKALKGAPVITREGKEVSQIKSFFVPQRLSIAGVIDGNIYWWTTEGTSPNGVCSHMDLFMAPEKKSGWIARYPSGDVSGLYGSEKHARTYHPNAIGYHEIEWEE